jgi:septum site-determining protein MinD
VIPESPAVLQYSNAGVPVILEDGSDAGAAYGDLVDRFLGKDLPHRFTISQKKGFLKRLFGGS